MPGGGLIHVNLTFAPNATPGNRVITVTSGGSLGSFFFAAAGQGAGSPPATFTVTGANCALYVSGGQKYSLGSDYLTTTVPLLVTSSPQASCPGTVVWTLDFVYQSSAGVAYSTAGPYTVNANLNQTVNFTTIPGTGGRLDAGIAVTIGGQTTNLSATFYVDGTAIQGPTIDQQLQQLFAQKGFTAYPYLMVGVAWHESGYQQFTPNTTLFGVNGNWPTQNFANKYVPSGYCVGLTQMCPNKMNVAYDWTQNTAGGVNIYATHRNDALNYQTKQTSRSGCGGLPKMTEAQLELETLSWYAGSTSGGPYLVPNPGCTGWIVNGNNTFINIYINGDPSNPNQQPGVLQWCKMEGHPNCQ